VLTAAERKDRLALVAPIVANLGHEVIAPRSTSKRLSTSFGRRMSG